MAFSRSIHPGRMNTWPARAIAASGDILAHLMKWWELGKRNIERYACDPAFTAPPVDVDAYNAAAVRDAAGLSEEELQAAFQSAVAAFIRFVRELPEDALTDERVQRQIGMELFGHYDEHRLP